MYYIVKKTQVYNLKSGPSEMTSYFSHWLKLGGLGSAPVMDTKDKAKVFSSKKEADTFIKRSGYTSWKAEKIVSKKPK